MLVNKDLANKVVATEFGRITFNSKGECKDLKPEQAKKLGKLPGFSYKEPKATVKKATTKTTTKVKAKEEPKKEEPKKEEGK